MSFVYVAKIIITVFSEHTLLRRRDRTCSGEKDMGFSPPQCVYGFDNP